MINAHYVLGHGREVSARSKWQRLIWTMPIWGPSLEQWLWKAVEVSTEGAISPHSLLVSSTGRGKSFKSLDIGMKALEQGSLVEFIGWGPLYEMMLQECIAHKISPKDVCFIDPSYQHEELGSPRFDTLTPLPGQTPEETVEAVVSETGLMTQRLSQQGPRMNDAGFYIFSLLQQLGEPVTSLHELVYNIPMREAWIDRCTHRDTRIWWEYFTTRLNPNEQARWLSPVINKWSPIKRSPFCSVMFSENISTVDIPKIINTKGMGLVVNLSATRLGEDVAQTLAQILYSRLKLAILQRDRIPKDQWVPLTVLVDEYSFIRSPVFAAFYKLARNYLTTVIVTMQNITAFEPNELREILGNSGTIMVMGSDHDEIAAVIGSMYDPTGTRRKSWDEKERYYTPYEEIFNLQKFMGKKSQQRQQAVTAIDPKGLYFMRTQTREQPHADPLLEDIYRRLVARYWYRPPAMVS